MLSRMEQLGGVYTDGFILDNNWQITKMKILIFYWKYIQVMEIQKNLEIFLVSPLTQMEAILVQHQRNLIRPAAIKLDKLYERCSEAGLSEECVQRSENTKQYYVDHGVRGFLTVPNADPIDWLMPVNAKIVILEVLITDQRCLLSMP